MSNNIRIFEFPGELVIDGSMGFIEHFYVESMSQVETYMLSYMIPENLASAVYHLMSSFESEMLHNERIWIHG